MRGAEGIPSELSWESFSGPVEDIRLEETAKAGHFTGHTALAQ